MNSVSAVEARGLATARRRAMTKRKLDAASELDRSVEDFYAALGAEKPVADQTSTSWSGPAVEEPAAAPAVEEPATATAAAAADLSAMTADLIAKDIVVLRGMPLPLQQALCDAFAPFAATPNAPAAAAGTAAHIGAAATTSARAAASTSTLCSAAAASPSFFRANNEKTRQTDMLHLGKHFVGGRLCDLGGVPPLVSLVAAEAQARGTANTYEP